VSQLCTLAEEQEFHFTEVRISDDEFYVFKPSFTNLQAVSGSCSGDFGFEYVDGTTPNAELMPLGNRTVRATPLGAIGPAVYEISGLLTDITTGGPYDPEFFRLRTEDGRVFDISPRTGVVRFEDRNGNFVQIGDDFIAHLAAARAPY